MSSCHLCFSRFCAFVSLVISFLLYYSSLPLSFVCFSSLRLINLSFHSGYQGAAIISLLLLPVPPKLPFIVHGKVSNRFSFLGTLFSLSLSQSMVTLSPLRSLPIPMVGKLYSRPGNWLVHRQGEEFQLQGTRWGGEEKDQ